MSISMVFIVSIVFVALYPKTWAWAVTELSMNGSQLVSVFLP